MEKLNWLKRFFNDFLMQFSSKKCNLVIMNENGFFRSRKLVEAMSYADADTLCRFTDILIRLLYQLTNCRRKVFMQIYGTLSRFSRR